ncbi:MAG: FapA family protein [Proteobacteria bacterium]|nr:FapA family protein [Pseudomonadota bacterium]
MAVRVKTFFLTETVTSGPEENRQTFTVSQLMPAGAILVALEGGAQGASGKASDAKADTELVPGDCVEFSADKTALLATTPGYPQMVRVKEGSGEKIIVDLEPLFSISEDGWTAKMNLYPPVTGNTLPSLADIIGMLEKTGVRSGVREKNVVACIAGVKTEMQPQKNHVIARGRLPVNGKNAWLRIDITVGTQVGQEQGDGHMDFRERHLFTGVDKGQLLATKVPATAGLPGVNVFGREVPQIPGKDLVIKTSEDVLYDEETGEIHAAIAGVLSAVSDTSVRVTAKLVLSGDIDFQTGNIESCDAVEIGGSIKPGFKVTTGGDVAVGGSVESAHISSRGNVVIRGGIMGEEATVEADGDVDVPVLDNGSISCKGSVRVSKEAYYAEIRALQDIVFTGQAKVVNSELFAGGSITVINVDTDTSPNSFLAAATMPERYARHIKLFKAYHKAKAAVDAWHRRFGSAVGNEELEELNEELVDAKASLVSYNLVPGVGERDRSGGLRYACRQKIMMKGLIRSGAVIRIGNTETTLKKTFEDGHFALNSDTGKLEFHSESKGLKPAAVEEV